MGGRERRGRNRREDGGRAQHGRARRQPGDADGGLLRRGARRRGVEPWAGSRTTRPDGRNARRHGSTMAGAATGRPRRRARTARPHLGLVRGGRGRRHGRHPRPPVESGEAARAMGSAPPRRLHHRRSLPHGVTGRRRRWQRCRGMARSQLGTAQLQPQRGKMSRTPAIISTMEAPASSSNTPASSSNMGVRSTTYDLWTRGAREKTPSWRRRKV